MVFVSWLFYAMSAAAVLVLRRKAPEMRRPYRAWGYPVTPLVFVAFSLWLTMNTITQAPRDAAIGAGIVLLGVPLYAAFSRRKRS